MKQLTVLFLVRGDEVLLAMKKRGFGKDRWNGVGGKVELGETHEQAMIRECQEEIKVTPLMYEKVAKIIFDEHQNGQPTELEVHVYLSYRWNGEPEETEEMAPKWFKKTDLPYHTMWADDPYWLPKVLEGKKLTAKFKLDHKDGVVSSDVHLLEQGNVELLV